LTGKGGRKLWGEVRVREKERKEGKKRRREGMRENGI